MHIRNKWSNRLLAIVLAAVLALSLMPISAFAEDNDIQGHWAQDTLRSWADKGWFTGDGAGAYRPNASVTRAEFMALINRMKGYTGESAEVESYTDVAADSWYYSAVSTALNAGYINGTGDTTMSPDAFITRQEAMTIIARIEGISSDSATVLSQAADGDSVADWATSGVAACIENGLVAGTDGRINPAACITRAESVVLMDRVYTNVRIYSFAGTYGPETGTLEVAAVNITAPDVILQNMETTGDLTVAASVGEGDVALNNVSIQGKFYVQGGGMNSVRLNNCAIKELIVTKDHVHVVLANGTTATTVRVGGDGGFVELTGNTTVETLTIEGDGAQVTAGGDVSIKTLNVEGAGTAIGTAEGTTITTANISGSNTEIAGECIIATANINSADVTIEAKPTTTNVADGISASISGTAVTGTVNATTPGDDIGVFYPGEYSPPKTVTFNLNYDGAPDAATNTISSGGKAAKPSDPTRDGYTFKGWYTETECTNEFDFDTLITNDTPLFAKWAEFTYTVTFDVNGGTGTIAQQSVKPGEFVSAPGSDANRSGYVQVGWTTERDGNTLFNLADTVITENMILYARWLASTDITAALTTAVEACVTGSIADGVTQLANLPLTVTVDTFAVGSFEWASDNAYVLAVTKDGDVTLTRPNDGNNATVTLTANLNGNSSLFEKTFDVTVLAATT